MFACLVENSPHELAEQVFNSLKDDYFDWNEVRVSTLRELAEVTKPLVDPSQAAERLKQTLHSVFEGVYQFDLETLKKQNIGQSAKQLQKLNGSTPFVVAYVTQTALGGHSIPVNSGLLITMHVVGVISDSEFKAGVVPGLERVVSKSKGAEIGSLLHQLGVEIGRNPYGADARKLLLEIDPSCKDRLPKRKPPAPPAPPPAPVQAKDKTGTDQGRQEEVGSQGSRRAGRQEGSGAAGEEKADHESRRSARPRPAPKRQPRRKPTTTKLTKRKPK